MLLLRRSRLLWLFAWPLYQCLWRGPSATSITCHSSFAQALSYSDRDGCDSATTCRVHERLAALAPFARVSLQRQMSLEELLPLMEGLAHWPSVLRTYNHARRRLSCVRNPEWRSLSCGSDNPQCTGSPGCREGACRGGPYNCTGILYGNSIFAPVIGSPSIQSLPMLR